MSETNIDTASPEQLVALIGNLEAMKARAYARLIAPKAVVPKDRMLNAREVAQRLGCGKDWVYEHAPGLPFAFREGKLLRFSASGLEAWLTTERTGLRSAA